MTIDIDLIEDFALVGCILFIIILLGLRIKQAAQKKLESAFERNKDRD